MSKRVIQLENCLSLLLMLFHLKHKYIENKGKAREKNPSSTVVSLIWVVSYPDCLFGTIFINISTALICFEKVAY